MSVPKNISTVRTWKWFEWLKCVACTREMRNTYKSLTRKPEVMWPTERTWYKWDNKQILIQQKGVTELKVSQERNQWCSSVQLNSSVFWAIMQRRLVKARQLATLKMEPICSPETLVLKHATLPNIPEDERIQIRKFVDLAKSIL